MLVVTPAALFGRLGAVLSALIVVFSLIGLTVHSDFYAGRRRRGRIRAVLPLFHHAVSHAARAL